MESPPQLPSQSPSVQSGGPPAKKGLSGCAIAGIIGIGLLFVIAILAAIAVPTFNKIQAEAQKVKEAQRAKITQVPLTEAEKTEAAVFAQKLLQTIEARGDVNAFVDYDALADLIYSGNSGERQMKAGFITGVKKTPGGIFSELLGQPGRFVRHWTREGVPALTLRFEVASGGVNFVDVVLLRQKTGGFKITDAYNYLFGVLVSRELRTATAFATGAGKGVLNQILGASARKQDMDSFLQFLQVSREGKAKEALALYHALPPAVKSISLAYIQYIKVLQSLGDEVEEEYVQALEKARGVLGADVTVDLLLVDRHLLRADFKAARKAVEVSLETVGGDSYLYHLLGLVCLKDNDVPAAKDALARATAIEPDLTDLFDLRLQIFAVEGKFPEMVAAIKAFESRMGAIITPDLLTDAVFDGFKKSPEFAAWAATTRKKAP